MLIEKEDKKNALSIVARKTGSKIIKMKPVIKLQDRKNAGLFPPRDEFNTGYMKARENDPL